STVCLLVIVFVYITVSFFFFFFFTHTSATEIYTLSLHDALPIFAPEVLVMLIAGDLFLVHEFLDGNGVRTIGEAQQEAGKHQAEDRKSTRLNSSHLVISYAVFCLKKKKKKK